MGNSLSNVVAKPEIKPTGYQCVKTNQFPFHLCVDNDNNALEGVHTMDSCLLRISSEIALPYNHAIMKAQFSNGVAKQIKIEEINGNDESDSSIDIDYNKKRINLSILSDRSIKGYIDEKFNFIGFTINEQKTIQQRNGSTVVKEFKPSAYSSDLECRYLHFENILSFLNGRSSLWEKGFKKCYYDTSK